MITILFLGIAFVILLWNLYYEHKWDKGVTIHLRFAENFVYATEQSHLIEQIENKKKLPLPVIEVSFRMRKELVFHDMENTSISDYTYKRDVFALLGNQRITRKLTVDCTKRGFYSIDKMDFKAYSLLFRSIYRKEEEQNTSLYVYAKRTNVNGILKTFDQLMGTLQCEKKVLEDPFAFSSIREYTITDPMKTINWKASAKTGDLMVNTFESTLTKRMMIYLDVEDSGIIKQEHLIEESISIAATLVQKMLNRSMEIGIAVCTKDGGISSFSPKSGKQQLVGIEQLLSRLKASENRDTFPVLLENAKEDAIPVFISKNATKLHQDSIEKFLKTTQGIWIVPYNDNSLNEIKKSRNIKTIRRKVEGS